MRQIYVQNFNSIGLVFQELSCKRPAGRTDGRTATLTDFRVYSLFEYTKMTYWIFLVSFDPVKRGFQDLLFWDLFFPQELFIR
jgi:hypothetical protein